MSGCLRTSYTQLEIKRIRVIARPAEVFLEDGQQMRGSGARLKDKICGLMLEVNCLGNHGEVDGVANVTDKLPSVPWLPVTRYIQLPIDCLVSAAGYCEHRYTRYCPCNM